MSMKSRNDILVIDSIKIKLLIKNGDVRIVNKLYSKEVNPKDSSHDKTSSEKNSGAAM